MPGRYLNSKRCVVCNVIMDGIINYEVREVCHGCGGKPLVDYSDRVAAAREALASFEENSSTKCARRADRRGGMPNHDDEPPRAA